jgi:hypothetical protein
LYSLIALGKSFLGKTFPNKKNTNNNAAMRKKYCVPVIDFIESINSFLINDTI